MENILNSIKKTTPEDLNALVIPPSYWGYPEKRVSKLLENSVNEIKKYGVRVNVLKPVITFKDAKDIKIKGVASNYDFVVLLVMTWTEAADMFYFIKDFLNKPVLLWGHTMWEEKDTDEFWDLGAFAGVGVVKKTLKDFGANFKFIYGMPGENSIKAGLDLFIPAVKAIKKLNFSRIGLLGAPSMGMYTAWQDPLILEKVLGPNVNQIDQYLLIEKVEKIKDKDIDPKIVNNLRKKWIIDNNIGDELLIKNLKFVLSLIDMINENYWDGFTIKCQYELSTHYNFTPCLPLSILADVIPCSCEGDLPLITTQILFNSIAESPVTYCDVHNITENSLYLAACGFSPLSLIKNKPNIARHSTLFKGLLNKEDYIEGKVTVGRLFVDHDGKAYFHLVRGEARTVKKQFREIGCSLYPSMEVFVENADAFAQNLASQHYAIAFKDIYKEVMEFCKLKGVVIL